MQRLRREACPTLDLGRFAGLVISLGFDYCEDCFPDSRACLTPLCKPIETAAHANRPDAPIRAGVPILCVGHRGLLMHCQECDRSVEELRLTWGKKYLCNRCAEKMGARVGIEGPVFPAAKFTADVPADRAKAMSAIPKIIVGNREAITIREASARFKRHERQIRRWTETHPALVAERDNRNYISRIFADIMARLDADTPKRENAREAEEKMEKIARRRSHGNP
jgi:hypothetical protein